MCAGGPQEPARLRSTRAAQGRERVLVLLLPRVRLGARTSNLQDPKTAAKVGSCGDSELECQWAKINLA
jgi:hypothetical protein